MERWINLLGYQIAWFVTVSGAGHGKSWPAWTASCLLCGGHFIASPRKTLDLRLMGIAALLGIIVDGFLAATGLLHYSPATPAVPVSGCPLWILALWLAFSTTLTRSLGWFRGRIGMALAFGAAGGPLAYWAAARAWGVIEFATPEWRGLLALAIGWAIGFAILVRAAGGTAVTESPRPAHSGAGFQ